jgi:6-methylpretetramide 4-monooxygenase / 4-hydroxy-6-methylpretetramide 12a-monooxygenase
MNRRIPASLLRVDEVGWASLFRMQRRIVPRMADPRRFLLGDAGHLSSPFGGEGLNSGLHDGHNLAWKLALQIHGRARDGLLDTFATERHRADQHVLAVSDRLHQLAHAATEAARTGTAPAPLPGPDAAALARGRAMLDTSYRGSPLAGEQVRPGDASLPGPGDRYPGRAALTSTRHTLLVSGPAGELAPLRRRWRGLVDITVDAGAAGGGAILVRPDGYVGFRALPADEAGLRALDAHLSRYLIPEPGQPGRPGQPGQPSQSDGAELNAASNETSGGS